MKQDMPLRTSTSSIAMSGSQQTTSGQLSSGPIDLILLEIKRSFDAKLYYAALCLSLSIPDVCSALETKQEHGPRYKDIHKRYQNWCKSWIEPYFSVLKSKDIWALRGGVIHNGMLSKHPQTTYDRIYFTLPIENDFIVHEIITGPNGEVEEVALQLDLSTFCDHVISGARKWYASKRHDPIVAANLPDLVRYRPFGIAGHVGGIPIIA